MYGGLGLKHSLIFFAKCELYTICYLVKFYAIWSGGALHIAIVYDVTEQLIHVYDVWYHDYHH